MRHLPLPLMLAIALAASGCALGTPTGTKAPAKGRAPIALPGATPTAAPGATGLSPGAGTLGAGRQPVPPGPGTGPASGVVANHGGALVMRGVVTAPRAFAGNGIIANNGGGIIANNGGGVIANNGGRYRLRAAEGEVPVAGATVVVRDAGGRPVLDGQGQPLTATTDATGAYSLSLPRADHNLVLAATPPGVAGELRALVPPGADRVDAGLVSSLTTTYVLEKYVPQAVPDAAQATLDRLPGPVEASTRRRAEAALATNAVPPPAALTPVALVTTVEAMRKADEAFSRQLDLVRDLLTIGATTAAITDGPAAEAVFEGPAGVAIAPDGSIVVADTRHHLIRRITAAGRVETIAGTGTGALVDGPAAQAAFCLPGDLAYDGAGNLFVADLGNDCVRRIGTDGQVTTLLAPPPKPAIRPEFMLPPTEAERDQAMLDWQPSKPTWEGGLRCLAMSSNGTLFVGCDAEIGKLAPNGDWTPIAVKDVGSEEPRYRFGADAMSADEQGNLFVTQGDMVWTVSRTGAAYLASTGAEWTGTAPKGRRAIVGDGKGGVVMVGGGEGIARTVSPGGKTVELPGRAAPGAPDFPGFEGAAAMARDAAGNLIVVEAASGLVRRMTPDGVVTTLAGRGATGVRDGGLEDALFAQPGGVAGDGKGTIYVADTGGRRIRVVRDGKVATLAGGTGPTTPLTEDEELELAGTVARDGQGEAAVFEGPHALAVTTDGTIWVVDGAARRWALRKVSPAGVVSTPELSIDDELVQGLEPFAIAPGPAGLLYVWDATDYRLLAIGPDGKAQLVWDGETKGTGGIGGATGLARTSAGAFYLTIPEENAVYRISPEGKAEWLVGRREADYEDGTPYNASFSGPSALAIDAAGILYVADTGNDKIRRVTPAGEVTTVQAGPLKGPKGLWCSPEGDLYVADTGNGVIRKIPASALR